MRNLRRPLLGLFLLIAAGTTLLSASTVAPLAASGYADTPAPCGIAPWTGDCVCAIGAHGRTVPYAAYAMLLHGTHHPDAAAAEAARRGCETKGMRT